MSTSTEYMAGMNAPVERRFYPRVTPPTPIYVAFGSSNLGVLHNVSENGFQVTTPESLSVNSVFKVFLTLTGASKAIHVSVRTIWTEETQKRSGIQLLDLAEQDRQQIRDWVALEVSRNENAGPSGWFPPQHPAEEQPVGGEISQQSVSQQFFPQQSAAPRPRANERAQAPPPPSPVRPSQPRAAAFAGAGEADQYANLFAAATNPEEFPPVPLPIHHDFVYQPPAESTKGRSRHGRSAQWRKKPLVLWAAVLAIVCFGADALVKHKIAVTSRRYAAESQTKGATPQNSEANAPVASADNSAAPSTATESAADSNSGNASLTAANNGASSNATSSQPADTRDHARSAPATDSALTAQTNTSPKSANRRSRASTLDSESAQPAGTSDSDSAAQTSSAAASKPTNYRDRLREYLAATAPPPASDAAPSKPSTTQTPAATQPSSAPSNAPPTASTATVSAANTATSPSANAPAPVRAPAPPPVVNSQPAPQVSNPTANNTVATNQPSNDAPATRAATNPPNSNASNSNPSAIYNTNSNAATQKSAILGSINSVRPSGIFATANSPTAPPPVSPDNSPSPVPSRTNSANSANSYVATRTAPVNSGTIQMDTQQAGDLQIPAPKGFNASYVEIPGERILSSPSATIHIQRLVRVPGERVPGQRWLWRGHMNVSLGELMTRVDPTVAQSAATSGSLTVEATIDKDGYVTNLKPLYGNFGMLPAVSRAVRSWRYQPTYLDNKRAETQAKIEFDLHPPSAANRPPRP
jgi:hypothetical protein